MDTVVKRLFFLKTVISVKFSTLTDDIHQLSSKFLKPVINDVRRQVKLLNGNSSKCPPDTQIPNK